MKLALCAHDMNKSSALVESIHRECNGDIILKEHIYGLVVNNIVVTLKHALSSVMSSAM